MTVETRSNGTGAAVLRLGDILPQRKAVEVNGTTHLGYVRGAGCPRSVTLAFQLAFDRWQEADEAAKALGRIGDPAAWQAFLNDALLAALPGLPFEMVDLISEAQALDVLRFLGWTGQAAAAEATDADAAPKDGAPPTGDGSSSRKPASRR